MSRCMLVFSLAVVAIGQGGVFASYCPSGNPGEILCEDFDTYCAPGQYPGGAGVPMGVTCPSGTPAAGNDVNLRTVWAQTSCINESLGSLCGSAAILDDSVVVLPDYYPVSLPFAGKYLNRLGIGDGSTPLPMAQHTFKDWTTGELNLSRFTGNAFGDSRYKAVKGEDDAPLVLSFEFNSEKMGDIFYNNDMGGISYSNGFMEMAFGAPNNPLNRANTDYVKATHCWIACNGTVNQGPFPVVCAIGNPEVIPPGGVPAYAGCPSVVTNPPPVHNALAVGVLPMVDQGPCHCGGGNHGGTVSHPLFFDGQLWWVLLTNGPFPTTGSVTPLDGATMPPPADIHASGAFLLGGGPVVPRNWMTLTVKTDTVKIELRTIESSRTAGYEGMRYEVVSTMENFPRKYKGPFDSLRSGVGPGCELGTTSWTSCASGKTRGCITSLNNRTRFVDFDDISLYGGAGWAAEGACCLSPGGGCVDDVLEADCQALEGGSFRGSTTTCDTEVCCPTPYADADVDGDIDAADFGALQVCYAGDITVVGKCSCYDHNGDGKVNQQDVESFITCATGPAIIPGAVPPECLP